VDVNKTVRTETEDQTDKIDPTDRVEIKGVTGDLRQEVVVLEDKDLTTDIKERISLSAGEWAVPSSLKVKGNSSAVPME